MHKFTPYKPRRTIISIPVKKEKRNKENPISPELDAFATIQTWPIDYKSRRVQISALEEEHERIRECHPPSIDRLWINQPTDRIRTRGRRWGRGMGSKATALLLSSREAREARRRTRAPPLSSPLLSSLCFALPNSRRRRQRAQ
jgi:hypothetical protein